MWEWLCLKCGWMWTRCQSRGVVGWCWWACGHKSLGMRQWGGAGWGWERSTGSQSGLLCTWATGSIRRCVALGCCSSTAAGWGTRLGYTGRQWCWSLGAGVTAGRWRRGALPGGWVSWAGQEIAMATGGSMGRETQAAYSLSEDKNIGKLSMLQDHFGKYINHLHPILICYNIGNHLRHCTCILGIFWQHNTNN